MERIVSEIVTGAGRTPQSPLEMDRAASPKCSLSANGLTRKEQRRRNRRLRKQRRYQAAYRERKRDAAEEAAMQLGQGSEAWIEARLEAWRQEGLEREELQRKNLAALSQEEIEGIKRIYGFDPVQNPLNIVMLHPKQNLAIHGFYEMVHG